MNKYLFKVLAADDEYWIRENLQSLLDWPKYSFQFLEPAVDGEDALRKVREDKPDILITDINMPFLSGTQLIQKVKSECPDTVILALSGYSDFEYVHDALVAGAVDYLLKPIAKDDLLKVLGKAVDIITSCKEKQQEWAQAKEELRLASSAMMDRELSQLIHRTTDENLHAKVQQLCSEYELKFADFTLVVFRTANLSRIQKLANEANPEYVIFSLKELISVYIVGDTHLLFNYSLKTNEFILITNMENQKLELACKEIISALQQKTGYGVTVTFSQQYFSFSDDIRMAYNEAKLAQMTRPYNNSSVIIHYHEIQNRNIKKRMSIEEEKQLAFAVQADKRDLFEQVVFQQIRFFDCGKNSWNYAEVHQTADSIAWILRGAGTTTGRSKQMLTLDNLTELLLQAVDNFELDEVHSVLEQMMDEVFSTAKSVGKNETVRDIVLQVQAYVNENYSERLSLSALAKRFAVEESYLSKAFKAGTGDNLMLYIAKTRMEHAKKYINQDRLSLTEISQLVGYDDYAYFNRVFRKVNGVSPREFKERMGDKR